MEVAGLVVGVVALVVVFLVERLRRPRLDINVSPFRPSAPIPWTFAAVRVHNRPAPPLIRWFISRTIAQGCAVEVSFEDWSREVRAIPPVPARWSGNPQPLRPVPVVRRQKVGSAVSEVESVTAGSITAGTSIGGGGLYVEVIENLSQYDPTLDPPRRDIPVSPEGEEVAVAILLSRDHDNDVAGGAYAWGTESYAHPRWQKPDWKLEHGTYRVRVIVTGSDVRAERSFKLEYLNEDFAKFVLTRA